MNSERLAERRKWFRVFPEGTLEFAIITRILALLLLISLAVVGGTQRPLIVVSLVIVLWVDYALLMWWVLQVAMDLRMVADGSVLDSPSSRAKIGFKVILPSVAAVAGLAPWGQVMSVVVGGTGMLGWLPVAAGVAFVILCIPALRALRKVGVGSSRWTALLLVPIIHWFALHRIAAGLHGRIAEQLQARGIDKAPYSPEVTLAIADATLVLSILPWMVMVGYGLACGWSNQGAFKFGPVCGTVLAALFAIANLAALEAVQRQIVTLIRKSASET